MKGRLSWLDIRAGVNDAQSLIGAHVKNIYSTSKKALLVKFSNKQKLLIDPPSKLHITSREHEKINPTPNATFLRKALDNARVERIWQLGFDRVAAIRLGTAEGPVFLVIEMYANGNIILTDKNMKIANLLRPVEHLGMQKEETYLINEPPLELNIERLDYVLGETLKKKISNFLSLSGSVVEDVISRMEKEFSEKLGTKTPLTLEELGEKRAKTPEKFEKVFSEFFREIYEQLIGVGAYGCVRYEGKRAVSFTPWKEMRRAEEGAEKEFSSFGQALDAAFTAPEIEETPAEKKQRKIRESQKRSLEEKQREVEELRKDAEALEANQEAVLEVIQTMESATKAGITREEFMRFKKESESESKVAKMVLEADFAKKQVVFMVDGRKVQLSYDRSLFEQINRKFQQAKKIEEKAVRAKVLFEESVQRNEEKEKKPVKVEKIERPTHWFEKFHWFVTKDGSLVIGGRDAKQNEILIRKHLKDTDYYFHADVQGGSSVIVGEDASEETKQVASCVALCMSKAWEGNVVVPVFCVRGEQVSKTAPAGEYLKQGSFMISGKKEFYHPYRLEYGFGILYKRAGVPVVMSENSRRIEGLSSEPCGDAEYAMAHAGPYKYVEGSKYRILPGACKKGMIIKELLSLAEQDTPEMMKCIRNISLREMELVVPGSSKLAQAEIVKRGDMSLFSKKGRKKDKKKKEQGAE